LGSEFGLLPSCESEQPLKDSARPAGAFDGLAAVASQHEWTHWRLSAALAAAFASPVPLIYINLPR